MILHPRFLIRELIQSGRQAAIFVLCVALSIATLAALNGFKRDVDRAILGDARSLHGGDILIRSHYDFSAGLLQTLHEIERTRGVQSVRSYDLYSVVRPVESEGSLLARLKIVEPGYPLYGRVELQSGRPFAEASGAGRILVDREVLGRLGVRIGDRLHIGEAVLTIADVVIHDRPEALFSLGPRIFVAAADLNRLQLLGKSSRVEYELLLKVPGDDAAIDSLAARLTAAAQPEQERVATYRTARSGMKRFFDNLFFFLSLLSIFTLFLAGIGMRTSLAALLKEKVKTLAVLKALGATNGFLLRHYLTLVAVLGLVGSLTGIGLGLLLRRILPRIFNGLIPTAGAPAFSAVDALEGLALGLATVTVFTFVPLATLRMIRPVAIFRHDTAGAAKGPLFYPVLLGGFLLLVLLVVRQLQDLKIGLSLLAGIAALLVAASLIARILLGAGRRLHVSSLALRQAGRSLLRPGNATRSIVVTLAAALSVLLGMYLLQANLSATYIDAYPADAPNLFFIDIQPDQQAAFTATIGRPVELYPVIRARLATINGKPVKERQGGPPQGDSLSREFNLTYRDTLLPDERLKSGGSLFTRDAGGTLPLQVSILDTVAEMGDLRRGDLLEFNIQGVPLKARVTSIRTRTKSRLSPFFYFVFPEQYLDAAPKTFFAALHCDRDAVAGLENRIAAAFPNISFINMAETAAALGGLVRKLTEVINFFAVFSIPAGALILVGSIFATRMSRMREAVYYMILGGNSRFVLAVLLYEHLLLGGLSSIPAVLLAQAGSWGLCHYLFDIAYAPHWGACLLLVLATGILVAALGLLSSVAVIRQRPAVILREQNND